MADIYEIWAEYYDLVEGDRTPIVGFYTSTVTHRTRSLLEFGCGTGVITHALATRMAQLRGSFRDIRVTGLDKSARMLETATRRDSRIEWVLGDFRCPPIADKYDLMICPFNVLQTLLDEADV